MEASFKFVLQNERPQLELVTQEPEVTDQLSEPLPTPQEEPLHPAHIARNGVPKALDAVNARLSRNR
jgi:hypothetical protein